MYIGGYGGPVTTTTRFIMDNDKQMVIDFPNKDQMDSENVETSTTRTNSAEPVREVVKKMIKAAPRTPALKMSTNKRAACPAAARGRPCAGAELAENAIKRQQSSAAEMSRPRFTPEEDRKIFDFIIKNEIYSNYKGLKVWEKMVKEKNVERSAKSLCCRFIKIVPNIETYGLPNNIEAKIKNGGKTKRCEKVHRFPEAGSSTSETGSDSEMERNEEYEDAVNVDTEKSKSLEENRRLEHNLQEEALKLINMKRKWHNEVMNLTDKMRVFCRIRPVLKEKTNIRVFNINIKNEYTMSISQTGHPCVSNFTFDKIFERGVTQVTVFMEVEQLIQSVLDDSNVCVLAYGQSGSGKTYTMEGGSSSNSMGIIPRAIEYIHISFISRAGKDELDFHHGSIISGNI
ncbi:non-claret disjunctional [Carabus blaptoides fortunei]